MELVESTGPYLCLNMIVKNESHIIKDTLTKLLNKVPAIDYWVISDTGSTDETKKIISDFFKERNIKGELFDDDWKDFGHNRTKALEHAFGKSRFLLVFDADDEICGDFVLPDLKIDSYHFQFGDANGTSYTRTQIVNNKKKWKYIGILHEIITCTEHSDSMDIIKGNYYTISGKSGDRSRDVNKYLKDALILEKAYEYAVKNNDDLYNRYGFYCANSYFDSGKYEDAIKWYKITLDNKNWDQEKYVACQRLYHCYNTLKQQETGMFYLVKSFSYDKERAECLYELVSYYCCNGMNEVAYSYYNIAKSFYNERYLKHGVNDKLFLDVSKANLFLPYYMILVSDKVKEYDTTIQMYRIIFTKKHIERSKHYIGNMLYNLQFFIDRVKDDKDFLRLFQEYVEFLISIDYPIYDHEFMVNYEKYGVVLPKNSEPVFSLDKCFKSKNILLYSGYSPFKWNYTFSINNALGGSETAITCLTKNFPKDYTIYVAGEVEEETVENIRYVHFNNLNNLIKTTAFHSIIVSRYLNFYELYRNFSAYQTFIWGHDVTLYAYGTDLSVEGILSKWASKITGCICQTEWHKNLFLSSFPQLKDKISTINNGINADLFNSKGITKVKKLSNRFIYTSCSERGLYKLVQLWPSILENLPDAELMISSYNNFPKSEEDVKILEIITKTPSIKHMGKLNRTELYNLMASAEYWLYTSYFQETSCITSLELLASEVICLYYPIAGLVNTVGDYGIPISEGKELDALLSLSIKKKNELKRKGKEYALSCSWENRAVEWSRLFFSKQSTPVIKEDDQEAENYTIKIINLKKRTDRRMKMETKLKNVYINKYEFFEAIDGKELKSTPELLSLFKMNDFNYKKGVMGCALSHIHLWNNLINDEDNDFYVIFEDDIIFCNNLKKYLNFVCKLFVEQKLEHLALGEYHSSKQFPSSGSTIEVYSKDLYKEWNLTFAYIISKSAAKKSLDYINSCSIKCAIDNPQAFGYILKYSSLNLKLVHCEIVNEFGSDIQNHSDDNNFIVTPSENKEIITVSFCDWWQNEYCGGIFDTNNNFFTNLLRDHGDNYEIKIVNPNETPNVLFYSIFGNSHQTYTASRKVFFSGEPYGQRENADFNITFDSNSYKNTRVPLWLCYFNNSLLDESMKRENNTNVIPNREKFCSFVATGPGLQNNRQEFVEKLSKYKQVDCGGSFLNNIGYNVPLGLNCSGKVEHNNNYKFAMAFESTTYPGYVTEKICDVFKSNCIPIYWGHPDIVKDFNPSSFINANDFANFDQLVDYVIKVDNDEMLYKSFFKSPLLAPEWSDILTDPNKTFFKNLADKIIGKNENLFDNLNKKIITNYNEKWYIYGPYNFYYLINGWLNSLNKNISFISNFEDIINPSKILFINNIFDKRVFENFSHCEISIINFEALNSSFFLEPLLNITKLYPNIKIYDYNLININILNRHNVTNTEFLEYKYNEEEVNYLKELYKTEKIYDFGFIFYDKTNIYDQRRNHIIKLLINNGFTVNIASGFDTERDIELSKCKIILNIHGKPEQSDVEVRIFEHLRCNRLLYAGFNVLSEISYLDEEFGNRYSNLKFIKYDDFEKITRENIENFSFNNIEFDKKNLNKYYTDNSKFNNLNNNSNLWIMYAFKDHNYNVIEDYINSLKETHNIVYTQDIDYVLSSNPKKISIIMYINDDIILNKFKNTDVELSFLNTEPLSISYNLDLLKHYINKHPYLKIYDYSFSNLQIILHNNMYGELLDYKSYKDENDLLMNLNLIETKIYDFGIITYGNTETNTVDNSLLHKKKDVVNELISKGFKIHIISGWGIERDIELAKCKVILNIHSILGINSKMYYSKTFENIRCNRLLDAGFKILSEDSIHCNELSNKYRENLKFINYDDFKNIEYSEDFWDKIDNKNKIKKYCFIHSCNIENVGTYRLDYLVDKLNSTKCINVFDKIYILNIGLPIENIYGNKFEIINYSNNIALYENPTINLIKKFSELNTNSYILYLHTKGVRYNPYDNKENDWIDYMLYFLLEKSQLCISILNNDYETVGCNYNRDIDRSVDGWNMNDPRSHPSHYSGNFWWANSNYLRTLPLLSIENPERMAPEFWLFKNNPFFYNLHSSQVSHFIASYPRNKYVL